MISVLHDPIFAVERSDGSRDRLGLLPLLPEAHRLKDLVARTPTGKVALLRLCLAFLLDAYQPADLNDRRAIFESGAFDGARLRTYAEECERDGPPFLLDDAEHPFMQAAFDPALDERAEKPIAALLSDIPSGNSHVHLDHRLQEEHEADAGTALEALLETYLFCPAGLSGPSGVNNTPPLFAMIQGRNLFETLALNMISRAECGNIPFGAGEVPWRLRETVRPKESVTEMSLLRALTWRPRRATLIFDEDGMVRRAYLQPGLDFRGNGLWMDPHVPYRRTKEGDMSSVKPELGRRLWRDAGMLTASNLAVSRAPVPLSNVGEVWEDKPQILDIELVGMATRQEARLGWMHERLSLPELLLRDAARAEEFRASLRMVENMRYALNRETDRRFKAQAAQQACELFLQRMYAAIFGRYREALTSGPAFGDAAAERVLALLDDIRDALHMVFRDVVDKCGTAIEDMRKQGAVAGFTMRAYAQMRKEVGLE